jgi:hypothetical protein
MSFLVTVFLKPGCTLELSGELFKIVRPAFYYPVFIVNWSLVTVAAGVFKSPQMIFTFMQC